MVWTVLEKQHDIAEIEQYFENKSYRSILGDSKTVFEPYPDPKNSPLGPQKNKNDSKIESELKEQAGAELGQAQPELGPRLT